MSRTTAEIMDAVKAKREEAKVSIAKKIEREFAAHGVTCISYRPLPDSAFADLPTYVQIASLLKENERLAKIEDAAKQLHAFYRGFMIPARFMVPADLPDLMLELAKALRPAE